MYILYFYIYIYYTIFHYILCITYILCYILYIIICIIIHIILLYIYTYYYIVYIILYTILYIYILIFWVIYIYIPYSLYNTNSWGCMRIHCHTLCNYATHYNGQMMSTTMWKHHHTGRGKGIIPSIVRLSGSHLSSHPQLFVNSYC